MALGWYGDGAQGAGEMARQLFQWGRLTSIQGSWPLQIVVSRVVVLGDGLSHPLRDQIGAGLGGGCQEKV